MTRRFLVFAALTLVLCLLPGCFTIETQVMGERGLRVFTGTRIHFERMSSPGTGKGAVGNYWVPAVAPGVFFWGPLDFPLSLAADLAMLPYTVPAQLIWGDVELNNPEVRFLIAVATDDMALARELIEEHQKLALARYRHRPLLAVVAATGQTEFVALLLERGADVNAADRFGHTALYYAVEPRSIDLSPPLYVEERELLRERARYVDVVQLLMKNGSDPHDRADAEYDVSPLGEAAGLGKLELLRVMVDNGAKVTARSKSDRTPLHDAALSGHPEVAEFLIEHGADVNARSEVGITPLHHAASRGHLEVARLLIAHDADVDARANDGETPLGSALRFGEPRAADLLRAHGGEK